MKDNSSIGPYRLTAICFFALILCASCYRQAQNAKTSPSSTPQKQTEIAHQTPSTELRNYYGVGVVTKIVKENPYDKSQASVELDHEEIEGLMPAMRMEFNVKTKSLLKGLKVGDRIDFTIEEKGGTEIISEIKKR